MNHEQIKQLFLEFCTINQSDGLPGIAERLGIEPETAATLYLLGVVQGGLIYSNHQFSLQEAKEQADFPACLERDYWPKVGEQARLSDLCF